MICGLKWKSCDCPWFSYTALEEDRLDNMQIPVAACEPRPRACTDEVASRRRQEMQDARIARRLQELAAEDDHSDDYQGGIGDILGIGTAGGHFLNESYVRTAQNLLSGPFSQANNAANYLMRGGLGMGRPAPVMRQNDRYPAIGPMAPMIGGQMPGRRASISGRDERPMSRSFPRPRRESFAGDIPLRPRPPSMRYRSPDRRSRDEIVVIEQERTEEQQHTRSSILAGLNTKGSGGGTGRINAWREHVPPGTIPQEGVLNVV
jgi:hypothetical protein